MFERVRNIESYYPNVFGVKREGYTESDERNIERVGGFVERYGWMYVAYQYAEFYRININEVYEVKLIEFLNYLAFMKDKGEYDMQIAKEQMAVNGVRK